MATSTSPFVPRWPSISPCYPLDDSFQYVAHSKRVQRDRQTASSNSITRRDQPAKSVSGARIIACVGIGLHPAGDQGRTSAKTHCGISDCCVRPRFLVIHPDTLHSDMGGQETAPLVEWMDEIQHGYDSGFIARTLLLAA